MLEVASNNILIHCSGLQIKFNSFVSVLRSQFGGHFVSPWSLFSATQIQQHGLWCQVNSSSIAGMGSNIGDMFYPTGDGPDGSTVVPTSDTNKSVPINKSHQQRWYCEVQH